ncbi:GerAB/ArcD/ProY family transporter [Litchfieldia salsa]|uniref:Spore germination protein (Amino acid permease) n=1 Tax=Litchfieldia salsa TaxID=930152 RepID=A0A1H0WQC8_9BACI|nr:GerAB/ArcD/ProY family transporter [Litchfieldia salsa]SDP92476.1 spore germination protein (amino acid permease) [Litchfieldia salsa]
MINDRFKISPYLVFFIISTNQIGVGVLGFQRIISKSAGNDSWIAIILAGIGVHIILFLMYRMLEESEGDIVSIHQRALGKWIGNSMSVIFLLLVASESLVVIRTYLEVIQVWMFPEINVWIFTLFLLLLVTYIIFGGFRTITGICFFSIILPAYLFFTVVFPLEFSHFRNLLPILDHSVLELAKATKDMSLSVIGFEVLFIIYPFIKNPEKSKKWAHLGVMYTTFVYLVFGLTALVFFSHAQLDKQIWATLSMWKIVELPIVERFEYVGIASWLLVIIPNVCLSLWGSSRLIKRLFNLKQKVSLWFLSLIVLIACGLLTNRSEINIVLDAYSRIGFYFIYGYIPCLFLLSVIMNKVRRRE